MPDEGVVFKSRTTNQDRNTLITMNIDEDDTPRTKLEVDREYLNIEKLSDRRFSSHRHVLSE